MTPPGLSTVETLLPLGATVLFLVGSMAVFAMRCAAVGRPCTPHIEARSASAPWKWAMEWWVWLCGPFERACIGLGVRPSCLTLASTLFCAVAAGLLATGHLSLGGFGYLLASSLDVVDGRVARAQGTATLAGAFLDSTLDRVSELTVFGGLAVNFRSTPTLYATLGAAAASVLVSYARARGEALGVTADARAGGMQRAERVVLTGVPCALAPLVDVAFGQGAGRTCAGSALALLAALTSVTAFRRIHSIWRALRRQQLERQSLANVRWLSAARTRERLGP